ncbi:MAG: hypothetical protein M1423_07165 [Acidobacteria bacterium]|nr:hypothetical protein [Acidobacteriota bacterium]
MAKTLDLILAALGLALMAVLSVYKLVQLYRYCNTPAKREWLLNQTPGSPQSAKIRGWRIHRPSCDQQPAVAAALRRHELVAARCSGDL